MATTRLSIINAMLGANGVDPVSTEDSTDPDVNSCLPVLESADRDIQSRGWWCNQEYNLPLVPDTAGEILLPSNVLRVDPVDRSSWLVRRGNKLYDPQNHTFKISTTVYVNMVVQLPISDLPDSLGSYLEAYAVHRFYVKDDGDTDKASALLKERNIAFSLAYREHIANLNLNARDRPAVARLIGGVRFGGGIGTYNPKYPGGR